MGRFMQTCCRSLIVGINTLTLIIALLITAGGIYVLVKKSDTENLLGASAWLYWLPLSFGVILSIVALVGCCAALENRKCCIAIYGVLQLLFGLLIGASGASLLVYDTYIENVALTSSNSLDEGFGGMQHMLSDFSIGAYQTCCGAVLPDVTFCPTYDDAYTSYCYYDEVQYNSGLGLDQQKCGEVAQDLQACPASVALNKGIGLKYFQRQVYEDFNDGIFGTGVAFCTFGCVLLLCFIGSMYLACCAKPKYQENKTRGPQYQDAQTTSMA